MQTQKTKALIARQLSKQELYYYFFPRSSPIWVWIAFVGATFLLFIVGLVTQTLPMLGFGLLIGLAGLFTYWWIHRLNLNDEQYDIWVRSQSKLLYKLGLQALSLAESQLSDHPMWIQSYVLPGSLDAEEYDADVVWLKVGKDGRHRSSVNTFTFIYPTARAFAIFKSDVNAFDPGSHNDEDDIYPYRHIIGATTGRTREAILVEEQEFPYQIEHFCLKLTNGETIKLSATIKAKPAGSVPGIPTLNLPDTNYSFTLSKMRMMLQ